MEMTGTNMTHGLVQVNDGTVIDRKYLKNVSNGNAGPWGPDHTKLRMRH